MAEENNEKQKTCFVVMGFGKKTDFETGRVSDLDKSYRNMIKPAVEEAGLKCIRADEIVHSGLIDVPMYEQLLQADVVVADISTSNKNAYYELGIRHALRPCTTLIVSEDGIKSFPFDISHVAVRQYHHLGEDIGFEEVMRFRKQLTDSIIEILRQDPVSFDSPVYSFLKNLNPPAFSEMQVAAAEAASEAMHTRAAKEPGGFNIASHSALMEQVDDAQKNGNWVAAKMVLMAVRQMAQDAMKKKLAEATVEMPEQKEDTYLLQRLALATYKSKLPDEAAALKEAKEILTPLEPAYSNDTETLGIWGAIHKRLYEINDTAAHYLDEAIRAYERGFYIKNDHYNGINYAYLLNVRAAGSADKAEAITDFVEARRVRKEVLSICQRWLEKNAVAATSANSSEIQEDYLNNWYWIQATIAEAYVGLEEDDKAAPVLVQAFSKAPQDWMQKSTTEQMTKLKKLLEASPLKYINN